MKVCSFCKQIHQEVLTKKHVFPNFLYKKYPDYKFGFNGGTGKHTFSVDQVKDVCKKCNNEVLSNLDNYVKRLCDKYFDNFIINEPVEFKYDYHLLLRWILKVSYNAARAYKTPYQEFERYLSYILGQQDKPQPFTLL